MANSFGTDRQEKQHDVTDNSTLHNAIAACMHEVNDQRFAQCVSKNMKTEKPKEKETDCPDDVRNPGHPAPSVMMQDPLHPGKVIKACLL